RRTWIKTTPAPSRLHGSKISFDLRVAPHTSSEILVTVQCDGGTGRRGYMTTPADALDAIAHERAQLSKGRASVGSSNPQFDQWLSRSMADVSMMLTDTPSGMYPYAGIPWYCTPFGRDGIITALQTLWVDPGIARGVLTFLAATQAEGVEPQQDAQPGKILHELRHGEMATLGEVPFGRYYGSVDATPLFVVLAARYLARTEDLALLRTIWPNIRAALRWCDEFGDVDHDGFIEYARMGPRGLVNQGWKDSKDAIFHGNGALARPPIALAEVQAYAYRAKRGASAIAERLGETNLAQQWRAEAESLQARFEQAFWCDDLGTYAIALDGDKRPCRVRTSNAGHVLFAGLASPERARQVAETLMNDSSFSG